MKRVGKNAVGRAGRLVLSAGLLAGNLVWAGNPYTPIVTRNVFGLNPVTVEAPPGDPPPKITLNGIMSISGHLQALFKVADPGKPGQQPKSQSYILSEGQLKDDIEVTRIDEKASMVTFNNHGVVQEIPMTSGTASSSSGPGSGSQGSKGNFSSVAGGAGGNGGSAGSFGRGAGNQSRGAGNGGNNYNNDTGGGVPALQAIPRTHPPNPQLAPNSDNTVDMSSMTREEQAAMILLNTEKLKNQRNPAAAIMPPMPVYTPPAPAGQPAE